MILSLSRSLDHLLNNMGGRRLIGIPHSEIDDVFATTPRIELEALYLRKNIRGQPFNPVKPVSDSHDPRLTPVDRDLRARNIQL